MIIEELTEYLKKFYLKSRYKLNDKNHKLQQLSLYFLVFNLLFLCLLLGAILLPTILSIYPFSFRIMFIPFK